MKIVVDDLAKQSLIDIYYYNYQYSLKNVIETNKKILFRIHDLEDLPYIGKKIPEIMDSSFRKIIYSSSQYSKYRIMYYISENTDTIYILYVINSKQNFNHILKLHNYFNNYFNF